VQRRGEPAAIEGEQMKHDLRHKAGSALAGWDVMRAASAVAC
jgi:hypothetical protein